MKVTVLSDELIKPREPAPHPRLLELSVIDQVQPRFHGPPILIFMPPLHEGMSLEDFVGRAKEAVTRALGAFYPLAGRLVKRDNGCLAIDCNDAGVQLRVAEADRGRASQPDNLATGQDLAGSEKLFFTRRGEDITTVPLVLLQVTRFQDNSLCIYAGVHHSVTDGAGSALFGYYFFELMMGKEPPFEPNHDRFLIKASDVAAAADHPVLGTAPLFPIPRVARIMMGSPRLRRIFPYVPKWLIMPQVSFYRLVFPRDKLKALKSDASNGLPAGRFVSTNDALSALMWRSITRARGLHKKPNQMTKMAFTVDVRPKTDPPLPETYFGNAEAATLSKAAAGELVAQPLSWSASMMRDAVSRVDATYIRDMVDWLDAQPNTAALGMKLAHHSGPDLFITTLTKFPLDQCDLGWGKAVSVGPGKFQVPLDGFVMLANGGGGVYAYVSLLSKYMRRLVKNEELKKYMS